MMVDLDKPEFKLIQELLRKERVRIAIDAHMYETGVFEYPHYRNMSKRKKLIEALEEKLIHPKQHVLWAVRSE
jgi:hypothetical protein